MKNDFVPILVVPAVPHEGGIRFLYCKNQIDIGPEMADYFDTDWLSVRYGN